jgi:2-phosphosulfolactate phosphatase
MKRTVIIDCFPESAARYRTGFGVVAIDVIRATTTATTALALGRRVFPARTCDEASVIASRLVRPLMVGELGGNKPFGFDITNSPAEIARRPDVDRPMVFVSSSGTQLIMNASGSDGVYLACLRNISAAARCVAARHERVAVIGAGTRGRFRREDQVGCARVAAKLLEAGYTAENAETATYIEQWIDQPLDVIREGKSAAYLRSSGQEQDLEFVLAHIDDLDVVPELSGGELIHSGLMPAGDSTRPTSRGAA